MKKIYILFLLIIVDFCFLSAQKNVIDDGGIASLAISPDGKLIAFSSPTWDWEIPEFPIYLIDVKNNIVKKILLGEGVINNLQFISKGQRIAYLCQQNIKSCNLQGEGEQLYMTLEKSPMIEGMVFAQGEQAIYYSAKFYTNRPFYSSIYQFCLKNKKTKKLSLPENSDINFFSNYENKIIYTSILNGLTDSARFKMMSIDPSKNDIITEIMPDTLGNYSNPTYHKSTNQLIFISSKGFCKMDMNTKKMKIFYSLKNKQLMHYVIDPLKELLYFYEIGKKSLSIIDFEGNERGNISLLIPEIVK